MTTFTVIPETSVIPAVTAAPRKSLAHAVSGGRPTAETSVRLTVRGRRLLRTVVVLTLLMLCALWAISSCTSTSQAGTGPAQASTRSVVVAPGESLWTVASRALPELDSREAVLRVRELNSLSAAAVVQSGQSLIVPISD